MIFWMRVVVHHGGRCFRVWCLCELCVRSGFSWQRHRPASWWRQFWALPTVGLFLDDGIAVPLSPLREWCRYLADPGSIRTSWWCLGGWGTSGSSLIAWIGPRSLPPAAASSQLPLRRRWSCCLSNAPGTLCRTYRFLAILLSQNPQRSPFAAFSLSAKGEKPGVRN